MNIIFDIGNVICDWNPAKIVRAALTEPDDQRLALERIIAHPDWLALDRGILTLEAAVEAATRRTGLSRERVFAVFSATPASLTLLPGVAEAIQCLHERGYALYLLSNIQRHCWQYLQARDEIWSCFRGGVLSFATGLLKPEPEIYRQLFRDFGLRAGDCIFLDDVAANTTAAATLGMQVLLVEELASSLADLDVLLRGTP